MSPLGARGARDDLHYERPAGFIEGPYRKPGASELRQVSHAAQRAGPYRTGTADLKDALRLTLDIQLCLTECVAELL
jgi:hypothetical protein